MSFITEIQATTEAAINEKFLQQQETLKAETDYLKEMEARELEKYSLDWLKEKIRVAASEGQSQASISVFSYQDQVPYWWEPVQQRLTELAGALEVNISFDISSLLPNGSDPLFDHTTYYGRAYLTW